MRKKDVDSKLIKKAKKGNKKAFDLLVQRYQFRLIHVVRRYLQNPNEALDVMQETFIKAYKALPNFRGESSFYSWLCRIAINTAKNFLQSKEVQNQDFFQQESEELLNNINYADPVSPEGILMGEQLEKVLEQALENMPEELRMVIILREMIGMSYVEISKTLDCPIGTVRSRLSRAREILLQAIEPLLSQTGVRK